MSEHGTSGPAGVVHRAHVLAQAQVTPDVTDHHVRDVLQPREVPHPAEALHLHHQGQEVLIRACLPPRPRDLLRLAPVLRVQPRQLPLDRGEPVGQQAGQPQRLPLGQRERGTPVQNRRGQHRAAP
jgi:hypothetical protein